MDKTIEVKGFPVYFYNEMTACKVFTSRRIEANYHKGKGRSMDTCPFCRKEIQEGANILMVINNSKLFPNLIVHSDCVHSLSDEELISICEEFTEEYEGYLKLRSIWG